MPPLELLLIPPPFLMASSRVLMGPTTGGAGGAPRGGTLLSAAPCRIADSRSLSPPSPWRFASDARLVRPLDAALPM
jgi:hypothetical protein